MDLEARSRQFVAALGRGDAVGARDMGSPNASAVWNGSERQFQQACQHLANVTGPWAIETVVVKRNVTLLSWQAHTVRGLLTFSWDRDGMVSYLNVQVKT